MRDGSSAVPHSAIKFSVPYVTRYTSHEVNRQHGYGGYAANEKPDIETHKANLADIIERIEVSIKEAGNAKSLWKVNNSLTSAENLKIQARDYAKFFSLKLSKLPAIPELEQERRGKLAAFDAARETRSQARTEARRAEWAEQQRLNALSREEKIAAWRAGSSARFWNMTGDGFALLRVNGSNVDTSQGVSVPINGLAGAGRLLRFLTACKDANRPYRRNGHTEHIGNFTVESFQPLLDDKADVSPTGEWILIAGCHRIRWQEIASISDAVRSADKTKPEPIA
jgi:hypothetical protein